MFYSWILKFDFFPCCSREKCAPDCLPFKDSKSNSNQWRFSSILARRLCSFTKYDVLYSNIIQNSLHTLSAFLMIERKSSISVELFKFIFYHFKCLQGFCFKVLTSDNVSFIAEYWAIVNFHFQKLSLILISLDIYLLLFVDNIFLLSKLSKFPLLNLLLNVFLFCMDSISYFALKMLWWSVLWFRSSFSCSDKFFFFNLEHIIVQCLFPHITHHPWDLQSYDWCPNFRQ